MKLTIVAALLVAITVTLHTAEANIFRRTWNYARDFAGGSRDMWRAYSDMRRAITIGADKYFHARGNYEAARRGTGGRHAATLISNAREWVQGGSGRGAQDSAADQEANRWGRNGGDPNRFRPNGLDRRYK
ncbi:serum amyloid A-2 protein-like [Mercenaria mercenaria]|uniref:serum amyloid A-2 protein-like n=1 Tax=Mercenaria mercenaria TaxID=6596 RepID=UPI00234F250D|nr:serum amyloid A-2 protein-like [Mercenaria mercenaria]XP_053383344.1 serum amyloid A-2 protein-like [Mercenaria mercenaria]